MFYIGYEDGKCLKLLKDEPGLKTLIGAWSRIFELFDEYYELRQTELLVLEYIHPKMIKRAAYTHKDYKEKHIQKKRWNFCPHCGERLE